MRLEIPIKNNDYDRVLNVYVRQLFKVIKDDIRTKANIQKYKVREPYILSMDFIKWRNEVPDHIDLFYYVTRCLVLKKEKECYVITLNDRALVNGSLTLVKDLIRLLEYGNEKLPAYPLIRNILMYHQEHWKDEFSKVVARSLN